MRYFIYNKEDNLLACMCVITDNNENIKSTKIVKHNFEKLTKATVEAEWPWIKLDGQHIFIYKGDKVPEKFQSFIYLLEDALKDDLPKILNLTKSELLDLPEHMIDFTISYILIAAIGYFEKNPEQISEIDAFELFKERNNLEGYLFEDLLIEQEEVFEKLLT